MRQLLANRSATIALEYAILAAVVVAALTFAIGAYGTALQVKMMRTGCHVSGRTWQEPTGPCT